MLSLGLNATAAEARWNKLFGSSDTRKDQVDACNDRGETLGKAGSDSRQSPTVVCRVVFV